MKVTLVGQCPLSTKNGKNLAILPKNMRVEIWVQTSEKYESSGRGPGFINGAKAATQDTGGWSYGSHCYKYMKIS